MRAGRAQQKPPNQAASTPITNATKIHLSTFPREIAQALSATWDKEGTGYVTFGELTAGATGGNSARNARQERQLSGMGKNRTIGATQPSVSQPGVALTGAGHHTDMPGDFAALDNLGTAEGQRIWDRMAAIIRKQRLEVRMLLDAHDRQNKGIVDLDTFRRALCYAFGNNWIELQ